MRIVRPLSILRTVVFFSNEARSCARRDAVVSARSMATDQSLVRTAFMNPPSVFLLFLRQVRPAYSTSAAYGWLHEEQKTCMDKRPRRGKTARGERKGRAR